MTPAHETSRPFRSREDAGRALALRLADRAGTAGLVVLGLPRGGLPIARAVADALQAPLDVIVARKLGVPGVPEVAFGAIVEGSDAISDETVRSFLGIPSHLVRRVVDRERAELARRVRQFRGDRPLPSLRGRVVVLVDDGIASGATARAAARAIRKRGASRIIVAAPVASEASQKELAAVADDVIVLHTIAPDATVSDAYDDFSQLTDYDVERFIAWPLADASTNDLGGEVQRHTAPLQSSADVSTAVRISCGGDGEALDGDLASPEGGVAPRGLIIFAHGGGSSRNSYRNAFLAGWLVMVGWATLRVDLLLPVEKERDATDGALRFDIALIASRLRTVVEWAADQHVAGSGNIVLFGASTGAAAAVKVAAERNDLVRGVMSRGGRIDLVPESLSRLTTPALLVVGTRDPDTLRGNRDALRLIHANATLRLIWGAGHTFEEPGAIGAVGRQVERWLATEFPERNSSWASRVAARWMPEIRSAFRR